jgi:hypothetical protein
MDWIMSGNSEEEGVARAGNTAGISTSMAKDYTVFANPAGQELSYPTHKK